MFKGSHVQCIRNGRNIDVLLQQNSENKNMLILAKIFKDTNFFEFEILSKSLNKYIYNATFFCVFRTTLCAQKVIFLMKESLLGTLL